MKKLIHSNLPTSIKKYLMTIDNVFNVDKYSFIGDKRNGLYLIHVKAGGFEWKSMVSSIYFDAHWRDEVRIRLRDICEWKAFEQ